MMRNDIERKTKASTTNSENKKRREITQVEMDNLLGLSEEFFWIDWIDKFIVKEI